MTALPSISFDDVSPLQLSIDGKLSKSLLLKNLFVGDANNIAVETAPNLALNIILPSQSTHAGKFLTTDGTDTRWAVIPSGGITGTGTINKVAKWASSTSLTDSQIFDTGTFVGIGISNPAHKLDIDNPGAGIIATQRLQNTIVATNNTGAQLLFAANRITSGLTNIAGVAGVITDITDTAYKGALIFHTANNAAPAERMRIHHQGKVSIGNNIGNTVFQINNDSHLIATDYLHCNNTEFINPAPVFAMGTNTMFSISLFSFAAGGPMLIGASNGTTVPSFSMWGIGDASQTGKPIFLFASSKKSGASTISLGANDLLLQIESTSESTLGAGTKLITVLGDGRTGFGLTNPAAQVHILSSASLSAFIVRGGGGGVPVFTLNTNDGTQRMILTATGLGIGDNVVFNGGLDPSTKLHVGIMGANLNAAIFEVNQVGTALTDLNGIILSNWNGTVNNFTGINFCDFHDNITQRSAAFGVQFTDRTNHFGDIVFATRNTNGFLERIKIDKNGNVRAKTLHNNLTPQGDSNNQDIRSGTFTPAYVIVANLDTLSGTLVQWKRVGNVVTVSGRFTADPTLTATSTSFTITLPVPPGFATINQLAGTAFCGSVSGMGAEIIADVAGGIAKVQWISSDITSQSWSYHFTYLVIVSDV